MRAITDHKLNGLNDALEIIVVDQPGQGGACHSYEIDIIAGTPSADFPKTVIHFQNGPIGEFGVNGISGEALLAIQIDRLRSFQAGPFACRENAIALTHCEDALMWLQKRTRESPRARRRRHAREITECPSPSSSRCISRGRSRLSRCAFRVRAGAT